MNNPQETETSPTEEEQNAAVSEAADLLPIGTSDVTLEADEAIFEESSEEPLEAPEANLETAEDNQDLDEQFDEVIDVEDLIDEVANELGEHKKADSPYDRPGRWYVVHSQSGYENKVRKNLEARIANMHLEESILEIVIPMEDVVEFRSGKKVNVSKKVFPGYLLIRCRLDDRTWNAIRETPGIVNFVGAAGKPSPLRRREVENFLMAEDEFSPETPKKAKAKLGFDVGETVRVKGGPFADFSGEIIEINEEQLKVKVVVDIFGRETPVELEFSQVAQL
ncbi:MAG: Transcription termination/antitermination protein NusG [Acidimicrobiales bacterium AG-410-I20]|nr:MAG: Transcription termination/antitermination protein NusG [Acidimicrobiales bacterium AG-410-I20]